MVKNEEENAKGVRGARDSHLPAHWFYTFIRLFFFFLGGNGFIRLYKVVWSFKKKKGLVKCMGSNIFLKHNLIHQRYNLETNLVPIQQMSNYLKIRLETYLVLVKQLIISNILWTMVFFSYIGFSFLKTLFQFTCLFTSFIFLLFFKV